MTYYDDHDRDHAQPDEARESRQPQSCACFGDMPGKCPGRANCPMEQGDDDDE